MPIALLLSFFCTAQKSRDYIVVRFIIIFIISPHVTDQKKKGNVIKELLAQLHVAEIVKLFGETLRALATTHSSKEKKYAQQQQAVALSQHKSSYTMGPQSFEGVKMLKIGQSAAKPL